jgi:glycosyltransferase involved in cell wall biosynthesis
MSHMSGQSATAEMQDLQGVRILVIMPSIPILGTERSNLQIMKMMRERGADVLFITHQRYGQQLQQEVEWIGCRWAVASLDELLRLPKSPSEAWKLFHAWMKAALQIDRVYWLYKPTHIHVTNMGYFIYALPTLWRAQQKVVYCVPNPPDMTIAGVKQYIYNAIWRYLIIPACNLFVCNSYYTLSELEKLLARKEKARVIHYCLPERPVLRMSDAPELDRKKFNIVFIGQMRPWKGVRELVEVALHMVREYPDVNFYFAGDCSWNNAFAQGLLETVTSQGLQSRIHFLGRVTDIFGLLVQADLHVCPSIFEEPFGLVVLEAKSQGKPSVVFPAGGLKEIVTHRVDGYVCRDKSVAALSEGIHFFLDNRDVLHTAGIAARQSLERFSRERISDEWADVFRYL